MGNLHRLSQISTVIARHGLGHYLEGRRSSRGRGATARSGPHVDRMARRFRAILEDLGPTFIKFGQILSTRGDLLPQPFVEALVGLQDHCTAMPAAEAEQVVAEALGRPVAAAFSAFSAEPVASASIAQVHRAQLTGGEVVAVKVQRPHMRRRILEDLDLLQVLARLVEAIVEESGMVAPRSLVDQFEAALMRELDFGHEAAMLARFNDNLAGRQRAYTVPKTYPSHCAAAVLTMDFIHGAKISAVGPEHDRKQVAENIMLTAFDQLFVDGLFHADPHPGNCFVLADGRLALVDFGATGELSYAMRESLVMLVLAIGTRDADSAARLLYRVGAAEERVSLHRLRDALAGLFDHMLKDAKTFARVAPSALLGEIFSIAGRFRLRMPSEYAQVARASVTVEGIIRQLDPELAVLERSRPLLRRLIEERFSLPTLADVSLRNLLRARDLMHDLPLTASQILMDLEGGLLRVQLDSPKLDQVARNIDTLGVVVFTGLVAGGLTGGSLVALGQHDWALWGLPLVPLVGLWAASLLFGAALGRYLLAPRLRKVSLGRLLARRRRRRLTGR